MNERKRSLPRKNNNDLKKAQKAPSLNTLKSKSTKKSKERRMPKRLFLGLTPQPSRRLTLCLKLDRVLSESLTLP